MATATITFEDRDDDTVDVRLTFDPPARGNEQPTGAQYYAVKCLELMNREDKESEDDNV